MSATVLFVGMDEINSAIGLAMGEAEFDVNRLGFDPERKVARAAKRAGVLDNLVRPEKGVRDAKVVIVGFLGDQMRDYMELLAPNMSEGSVVIDTSPFKSNTASWIDDVLPEHCSYVGIAPSVNVEALLSGDVEDSGPSAEQYRGGLLGVILPANAPEEALNAALNIAQILGAKPFFIEAAELDAAQAASEWIPALISTALLQAASKDPGWRNVQRLAGPSFSNATALSRNASPEVLSANIHLGRDFVVAKLDVLLERLQSLRDCVAAEKTETLLANLTEAKEAHLDWLRARQKGQWDGEDIDSAAMTRATMLGSLVGYDPDRHKRKE
jgi:prephenate dehydrogenase